MHRKKTQHKKHNKEEKMMDNNLLTIGGTLMAILTIVSRILLFRKAGRSFWLAVIPVVSRFTEYNICWKGGVVVLQAMFVAIAAGCAASGEEAALVAGAIFLGLAMIVQLIECLKLAKAFVLNYPYLLNILQSLIRIFVELP